MENYYTDQIDGAIKRNDPKTFLNIKIGDSFNMSAPPQLINLIRDWYADNADKYGKFINQ